MSEQSTHDGQQQPESPLKTERGSTTVQDGVVSKVAGIAAQEVDGVRMGGSTSQTADSLLGSITVGSSGGSASRGSRWRWEKVGGAAPPPDPHVTTGERRTRGDA